MSAREELRRAVAAEFQRLDAHQFGYDHGFCADPDADPETGALVDAAIRIVLNEAADALAQHRGALNGLEWPDAAALLRDMADTDTTQET